MSAQTFAFYKAKRNAIKLNELAPLSILDYKYYIIISIIYR